MNALVLSQNPFRLAAKIVNAVDVIFAFGKICRMVDAMRVKAADIQRIIRRVRIGVDLAMTLENTKDNHFACSRTLPKSLSSNSTSGYFSETNATQ